MISPSNDITWSLAEAEAAHAGFSEIGLAHFWVGVCKAVEVSVSELLKAGSPELQAMEGQVEADFLEVREAFSGAGLSPKLLRRAIRAEIERRSGKFARPLHRSPTLREVFKQAVSLASVDGGRLRPAHLVVTLVEQWEPVVSSSVTKLGHDPDEVLRGLSARLIEGFEVRPKTPRRKTQDQKEEKQKDSALRRFGRDLTELAAQGALPPLIGRRAEMLKITQILLQSRKNNLILVGEPGVGKTGIVEGFAQLLAEGKLPEALGRPAVIEISLTSLVAGTKYRGEFEERLEAVVREASQEPKPILFIDEIHLLLGAGSASGSMDAANILKPAPPGYVGHDEGGQLSDAIRTHPYSVVLFDEIEKAHPRVLDLFLQIFDEGTLTDAQGRKCDFRESVIILTSNLGSGVVKKRRMGFGMEEEECGRDANAPVEEAIRKHLRPELVNRLTKVVHFKPLEMETAREILGKLVAEFNRRLADRNVTVALDESAEELILREGFSKEYGARNLERVMDRLLGSLVAEALMSGKITAGQTLHLEAVDSRIQFREASSP